MPKTRVIVTFMTWKGMSIGAKHYHVSIREDNTSKEDGLRFDSSDFKYKPHAKKWAEMIISENFDQRGHDIEWQDLTEDPEDYELRPPGRY